MPYLVAADLPGRHAGDRLRHDRKSRRLRLQIGKTEGLPAAGPEID